MSAGAAPEQPAAPAEPGQYGLLALSVLAAMSLWFSASAVVPQLALHWQLDAAARGWLTASVQLGFVAGALTSAFSGLADRVPVPRLIAVSALLAAVCNAAIALPGLPYAAAVALRGLTGVCLAGVYPPGMKLVASWTRRRRGLWVGVLIGALTLGSSMPHLLNALASVTPAAAAAAAAGAAGGTSATEAGPPWRVVVLGASALGLLGALLALPLRTGPFTARATRFRPGDVTALLVGQRAVRLANIGYLGHMWELYAMWTWMPIYLVVAFGTAGYDAAAARWTAFAAIAVGAPGCVLAGWLADRLGRSLTTIIAMTGSGLAALGAALAFSHPLALTIVCLIWGFTVIADSGQFSTAVSELAEPDRIGTALTLQTALGFLLTMVSIQLLPLLAARVSWPAGMAVLAVGPFVGCLAMWRLRSLPEAAAMAGGRR